MITEPHEDVGQMQASDNKIIEGIKKEYAQLQDLEIQKQAAVHDVEIAKKFEEVRTLGFITKKDLEEFAKSLPQNAMVNEVKALRDEYMALKDFVLRSKVQSGLNGGTLDQSNKPNPADNPMMKFMLP